MKTYDDLNNAAIKANIQHLINNSFYKTALWFALAFDDDELNDPKKLSEIIVRQIDCLYEEVNETNEATTKLEKIDGYIDTIWVAFGLKYLLDLHNPDKLFNYTEEYLFKRDKGFIDMLTKVSLVDIHKFKLRLSDLKEYGELVDPITLLRVKNNLDAIITVSFRGILGLFGYSDKGLKEIDSGEVEIYTTLLHDLYNEVVSSNFSKVVNGVLPRDETGKITKQPAKDKGIYHDPDFTKVIDQQSWAFVNELTKD